MSLHPHQFSVGPAISSTRIIAEYPAAVSGLIEEVLILVDNAPVADVIFDILKNGSSIYGSPTGRPKILAGTDSIDQTGLAVSVTKGDLITWEVASIFAFDSLGAKLWGQLGVEDGSPSYFGGTSVTSFAIGTGSQAFTTQAGLAYVVGSRVRLASSASPTTNWVEGVVTAYSGTTLTVTIDKIVGSGTHTDWLLTLAGQPGTVGATGSTGATGATGVGVPTGGTTGQVLKKNSGTDFDTGWGTGGGGGASVLDDLTDVDTTSVAPTDGQALLYDNSSSLWKPGDVSGGGGMTQVFPSALFVLVGTAMVTVPGFTFNMVANGAYLINFDLYCYVDGSDGVTYNFTCLDYAFGVLHTEIDGDHLTSERFDEVTPMAQTSGGTHGLTHSGYARARVMFRGFVLAPSTFAHSGAVSVQAGSTSGGGNSVVFGGKFEYKRLY